MNPVTAVKIGSTAIVFGVTVLFGLLPLCIIKRLKGRESQSRASAAISYLNCFAGGVFLGTAMLHMLAESEEQVKEALNKPNATSIDYPITEIAISGGFLFILFMEVVVLKIMHGVGRGPGERAKSRRHNPNSELSGNEDQREPLLGTGMNAVVKEEATETLEEMFSVFGVQEEFREILRREIPFVFRSFVLVLVLSLHMIFEGLAIGLQETESDVWTLLLAVSLHKCIVAFSIGLEMRQVLKSTCTFLGFIIFFSTIASLGIPIGMAITDTYEENSLVVGLLQAVATGTFFFVTFFEILQREFSHCQSVTKLFLCTVGYILVAILKIQDDDRH